MTVDLNSVARRLYEGVMAPLVLGGAMRPGHAIGARAACALADDPPGVHPDVEARVQRARVRRARALAPVDELGAPAPAEWALAAALHDTLQSANPAFASPLRRRAGARILALVAVTLGRVPPPANAREALSRHTWLARLLEIARTDTVVSWWVGSRAYLGVDPPPRLQAWPELRRVKVARTSHALMDLAHAAVDPPRFAAAVQDLLAQSPLTDLATCARSAPPFSWTPAAAGLVATGAGRTLVMRALGRVPSADVDAALGRATREALRLRSGLAPAAVELLAERAIALACGHLVETRPIGPSAHEEAAFARCVGAAAAARKLARGDGPWLEDERRRMIVALEPAARDAEASLRAL